MAKAVVVRYQTRPDAGDRNQHLIEQVLAELNAEDPGGIRYAAFRDGTSERQAAPPVLSEATLASSYRFAKE